MPAMDATGLLLAFVVMTLGASIQGVVGFGANLLAAPLLALIDPQLVPGHEIVGEVISVGSAVKDVKVGTVVGLGCIAQTCGTRERCT